MSEEKSKALTKQTGNLPVWTQDQVDIIRKSYAPDLNELEFKTFLNLALAAGANPFLKEIWSYKIIDRTVIILGRDYFRNIAQSKPDYKGHRVMAVYENDDFVTVNGVPEHRSSPNKKDDRGRLTGAFAIGWRENKEPYFVHVDIEEYDKGQSTWKTLKTTMIKKVAEAQLCRMMYGKDYPNAYSDAELPVIELTASQNKNGSYSAKIPPPEFENTGNPKEKKSNDVSEAEINKFWALVVKYTGSDPDASLWLEEQTTDLFKDGTLKPITDPGDIKSPVLLKDLYNRL